MFKPGDLVISNNDVVINPHTGEPYVWGGYIKKDTVYEVSSCNNKGRYTQVTLKNVATNNYHAERFKLYKKYSNTILKRGGNI